MNKNYRDMTPEELEAAIKQMTELFQTLAQKYERSIRDSHTKARQLHRATRQLAYGGSAEWMNEFLMAKKLAEGARFEQGERERAAADAAIFVSDMVAWRNKQAEAAANEQPAAG